MPGMTVLAPTDADVDPRRVPIDVEIVVPVYNEAAQLAAQHHRAAHLPRRLVPLRRAGHRGRQRQHRRHLRGGQPPGRHLPGVAALHLPRKGRGCALRTAWSTSTAPVVAYMDVDLSTSLRAAPVGGPAPVGPQRRGHRLPPGPRRARGARPQARADLAGVQPVAQASRCAAASATRSAGSRPCARDAARQLLPLVEDDEWFFDTELLVTAERLGLRISEVPVDWVDDPDSRVKIVSTALDDLPRRVAHRGTGGPSAAAPARLRTGQVAADQLLRFAGVGVVSTLGYLFLFVAWRPLVGAFGANALAMAIVHRCSTRRCTGSCPAPRRAGPPRPARFAVGGRAVPGQPGPDHARRWWSPRVVSAVGAARARGGHRGQRGRGRAAVRRPAGLGVPPEAPDRFRGGSAYRAPPLAARGQSPCSTPEASVACSARPRRSPPIEPAPPARGAPAGRRADSCGARRATRPGCAPRC